MCGIVGYVGPQSAIGVISDGLRRLEYRGYDSAGVALVDNQRLAVEKRAGKLANLSAAVTERAGMGGPRTGIGHTRWATHGAPTDRNAHPHVSADGRTAIIHNGIIENFAQLRTELESGGIEFASDTDSECVVHLLAAELESTADLSEAMRRVCRQLEGAFTLLAVHADLPGTVVGARRNSPLVAGIGDGEYFLASDVAAFISHTREAVELGQDQVVTIDASGITITDFDGIAMAGKPFNV
ncbi:MAG: glutamine--fructose-6-phosphate transaminase (isomerizing), partial [Stackebrandtia sp.]